MHIQGPHSRPTNRNSLGVVPKNMSIKKVHPSDSGIVETVWTPLLKENIINEGVIFIPVLSERSCSNTVIQTLRFLIVTITYLVF